MKPNFIDIGGQRCATTWIFNSLKKHPQVSSNLFVKEIHFLVIGITKDMRGKGFKGCQGGDKGMGEVLQWQ